MRSGVYAEQANVYHDTGIYTLSLVASAGADVTIDGGNTLDHGVLVSGTGVVLVEGFKVKDSVLDGIYVSGDVKIKISRNTVTGAGKCGILVEASANGLGNEIKQNMVSESAAAGIYNKSNNTKVLLNTCNENGGAGLRFTGDNGLVSTNISTGNVGDGILVELCDNTTVMRNTCTDNGLAGIKAVAVTSSTSAWTFYKENILSANGGAGIVFDGSGYWLSSEVSNNGTNGIELLGEGNNVTSNLVSRFTRQYAGIKINSVGDAVKSNQISAFKNGVQSSGTATISKNTIYGSFIGVSIGGSASLIEQNEIHATFVGVQLAYGTGGHLVRSNMVYSDVHLFVVKSHNNTLAHNSGITHRGNGKGLDLRFDIPLTFVNNILILDGGTSAVGVSVTSTSTGLVSSNNIFWLSSGSVAKVAGTTYDLAGWQGVSGQGVDSLDVDPGVVSVVDGSEDLHISVTSPAHLAGVYAGRQYDFDGDYVSNHVSIGADEAL